MTRYAMKTTPIIGSSTATVGGVVDVREALLNIELGTLRAGV
ncbi:hypothetical protein [Nostoc sp.]